MRATWSLKESVRVLRRVTGVCTVLQCGFRDDIDIIKNVIIIYLRILIIVLERIGSEKCCRFGNRESFLKKFHFSLRLPYISSMYIYYTKNRQPPVSKF